MTGDSPVRFGISGTGFVTWNELLCVSTVTGLVGGSERELYGQTVTVYTVALVAEKEFILVNICYISLTVTPCGFVGK